MGKQQQSKKQYSKGKFNNVNPYNRLDLNKYHQIGAKADKNSQSKLLHKRARDLERLIKHKEQIGQDIDDNKYEELNKVKDELEERKKKNEKNMRKQFFIKNKYKQIMEIEMRKVVKKVRSLKDMEMNEEVKIQLAEWEKKLRYIKYYPKNLKYVSLFPNAKPLDDGAIEFQQKIMDGIEEKYLKKTEKMNKYVSENKERSKRAQKRSKKDQFFMEEQEE